MTVAAALLSLLAACGLAACATETPSAPADGQSVRPRRTAEKHTAETLKAATSGPCAASGKRSRW